MSQSGTVDPDDLRRALRGFASGVTVVTSRGERGEPLGMTVSAFASVSLAPPLILVSLHRNAPTTQAIAAARAFAVNILAEGQESISRRFASRDVDRFQDADWRPGATGAPLLAGALAHLECSVHASVPGGDHDVILGSVLSAVRHPGRPLVYFEGDYRRLPEPL
jgi:3-hydroxy-9,10-secoandrosta-1,3,5(10)-triene-9,17-dione monooxygenase reductase component